MHSSLRNPCVAKQFLMLEVLLFGYLKRNSTAHGTSWVHMHCLTLIAPCPPQLPAAFSRCFFHRSEHTKVDKLCVFKMLSHPQFPHILQVLLSAHSGPLLLSYLLIRYLVGIPIPDYKKAEDYKPNSSTPYMIP